MGGAMLIQVNSDNNIIATEALTREVESVVESSLGRFDNRLTRVEVHLTDENSSKGGNDKRCVMEARPNGLPPMAASDVAPTLEQAIAGAAEKLERVLESRFGKLNDR
jgi:ribosome-associated translation inhibitor RaiA